MADGDKTSSLLAEENAPKYEQLARRLRHKIRTGEFPVGSRLPGVRQLSKEFGLSVPTAFRSVQELCREGLLASHASPRGTVVVRREPRLRVTQRLLTCLLRPPRARNAMDNFALDMIQGVRDEISARHYRFVHHGLDEKDYEKRVRELAEGDWTCGLLLDQYVPASVTQRLVRTGLPVCIFNREDRAEGLVSVCPDYQQIGRDSLRMALERGYGRVGFVCDRPRGERTEAQEARLYPNTAMTEGFRAEAAAAGLGPDRCIPLPDADVDGRLFSEPEGFGLPARRPADWVPLAVFATTDTRALRFLDAVARTDLALGRDVGVIGCYDLIGPRRSGIPPSTWRIDARAVGATAARELFRKIDDPEYPAATIRIRAEFVDRGTV